jgi:hypothetical protein
MVNYGNSKVYKIISSQTDKIYIGSTTKKYLSSRMVEHRCHARAFENGTLGRVSSLDILQYDDAQIVLLEAYPNCQSRDELRSKEQLYIDANKGICINKQNASGHNIAKYKENKNAYYIANKERKRQYQLQNKQRIREQAQDNYWRKKHDEIDRKYKEFYECV